MNDYNLGSVRLTVYHPHSGRRRILYDTLNGAGFRSVFTTGTIDKLRSTIQQSEPDMLIIDADGNIDATAEVARDIRYRRLGSNPYVVIFAVTWTSEEQTVINFLDAGADDIVAMPASVNMIARRVAHMIEERKNFVVSSSYIGPDRREGERESRDELGTFSVPNGLRYKATGDITAAVDPDQLRRANEIVDEHSLRRAAMQFDSQVAEIEAHASNGPEQIPPRGMLWQLSEHARTINDLAVKSRPDLVEIASSLQSVVRAITTFADAPSDVVALARVHGQALLATLRGADEAQGLISTALQQATAVVGARSFDEN